MPLSNPFPSRYAALAAIQGFIAVAAGAFGAHVLTNMVDEKALGWWHTGSQYLMYHALAALLVCSLCHYLPSHKNILTFFLVGNLLFAGSLYVMTVTGQIWLGAITPMGGIFYLIAWFLFAKNLWQHNTYIDEID